MSGNETQAAGDRVADAHRTLTADPDIQFSMAPHASPVPAKPPEWWLWLMDRLRPIGRLFGWLTDLMPDIAWARFLLWTLIGVAVAFVLVVVIDRIRHGEWRVPRRASRARAVEAAPVEPEWTPEAAPAREWLAEADALAERGLYAEAVRHLLFRSIDDIARRRPLLVRPSLTSRELARASGVPTMARALFAGIAGRVERSLFGGRPVGADDWRSARAAYADFALPEPWRG